MLLSKRLMRAATGQMTLTNTALTAVLSTACYIGAILALAVLIRCRMKIIPTFVAEVDCPIRPPIDDARIAVASEAIF